MQQEITLASPLLDQHGRLAQKGYLKRPLLDYNPERLPFLLRRFRLKEWDYYGVFIGRHFVSFTVSHIGYAGLIFAYWIDFERRIMIERPIITPLGRGCRLPQSSETGDVHFEKGGLRLDFRHESQAWRILVDWPDFDQGRALKADLTLHASGHGITMATPIGKRGFYYNHKLPGLSAHGRVSLGEETLVTQGDAFGVLDWGRGVWDYDTFWNWGSASGRLPDGRILALNIGLGFGDLSAATENSFFLDGRMNKLGKLSFDYTPGDFMKPWRFRDQEGRLDLTLTPHFDRTAKSNLLLITSEVHQMFGTYSGTLVADDGERLRIEGLQGWAEDHRARW